MNSKIFINIYIIGGNPGRMGSIKAIGFQPQIIDKKFFCMGRKSRIGLFFSIELANLRCSLTWLVEWELSHCRNG